jgi:hypothetical protein
MGKRVNPVKQFTDRLIGDFVAPVNPKVTAAIDKMTAAAVKKAKAAKPKKGV